MEPAAHVVSDPALRHARERLLDDLARPVLARVVPAGEQEVDGRGVGELRRIAEAAVADIEQAGHLGGRRVEDRGRHLPALRLVERFRDVPADRLGALRDPGAIAPVQLRHLFQDRDEPGAAVVVVLGWEVGAAEEDLAVRREECREWPADLPGQRLDGTLIAGIHVGPLVAVHLDADEVAVQDLRHLRILVRLAVHHMAPVAPHRADVEEDRLLFGPRLGERRLAPGTPVHRLMGGGLEVGGGLGREQVGHGVECTRNFEPRALNPGLSPGVSGASPGPGIP